MKLSDKVAIVTGGTQGIGAAVVSAFLKEGAIVFVGDIKGLSPKTVRERRAVNCKKLYFFELNVAFPESVETFVNNVMSLAGRVDILVNNAGITSDATLLKMTPEQFDRVIRVNLYGVFNMTKAVAPIMVLQGSWVILNASSVVAEDGNFGQTNYVASKCAVEGMTKTWARELAKKGVRVNAVAPGFTETPMANAIPEEAKLAVSEKILLKRFATPEEIASSYLYLATASYVTGTVFAVNGGLRV